MFKLTLGSPSPNDAIVGYSTTANYVSHFIRLTIYLCRAFATCFCNHHFSLHSIKFQQKHDETGWCIKHMLTLTDRVVRSLYSRFTFYFARCTPHTGQAAAAAAKNPTGTSSSANFQQIRFFFFVLFWFSIFIFPPAFVSTLLLHSYFAHLNVVMLCRKINK